MKTMQEIEGRLDTLREAVDDLIRRVDALTLAPDSLGDRVGKLEARGDAMKAHVTEDLARLIGELQGKVWGLDNRLGSAERAQYNLHEDVNAIRRPSRHVAGGRQSGKTENLAQALTDAILDGRAVWTGGLWRKRGFPDQKQYRLFCLPHLIASTDSLAHARGIAHSYSADLGANIRCFDRDDNLIFEVDEWS